jgi:hypothetical protein
VLADASRRSLASRRRSSLARQLAARIGWNDKARSRAQLDAASGARRCRCRGVTTGRVAIPAGRRDGAFDAARQILIDNRCTRASSGMTS